MNAFKNSYVLCRIRLINFHNIQNETLRVERGGHLFLLGDNGSGKTTVLDAIHYVLTGGELVEFNSAARVAGQQSVGRRIQGIIMRFNTETGPINKEGGITYAILELKNEKGQFLTVGMGMTAKAMDEPVQRWGIVIHGPLEEVPLLIEELQGERPMTRVEMKAALDPVGGFYNMGPFRRELVYRLFNNDDVFADVCRLLRIGKAYREIVAQSNDYHELFMRLMPEPKTEVFENVILSLQSLEDSKTVLEDFERKRLYVRSLAALTEKIRVFRKDGLCFDWLDTFRRLERLSGQISAEKETRQVLRQNLVTLDEEQETARTERETLTSQLADLKTKDHAGLVRGESELSEELRRKEHTRKEDEAALKQLKKKHGTAVKDKTRTLDELHKFLKQAALKLARFAADLPFPVTNLTTSLDYLYRREDPAHETPMLPVAGPMGRAREQVIGLEKEQALLEKDIADLSAVIKSEEGRIEELEAAQALAPDLDDFREARALLSLHMISARPLYEGLEWRSALAVKLKSAIEELIGTQVLASFLVSDDQAEDAKKMLFKHYPGQRVTHPSLGVKVLPDWFRTTFDLSASNPEALACLAGEMQAAREPEITSFSDRQLLRFRAHERRLRGLPARLIGADSRKKAVEREIKVLKRALKEQTALRKTHQNCCAELSARTTLLREFIEFLEKTQQTYRTQISKITHLNLTEEHMDSSQVGASERFARLTGEVTLLAERLETIRAIISKEGLANLETRISRAAAKLARNDKRLQEIGEARGGLKRDIHLSGNRIEDLHIDQTDKQKHLRLLAIRLMELDPEVEDAQAHVLGPWKGSRFKATEVIAREKQKCRESEVEARARLGSALNEPSLGASFAFVYDEDKNLLVDRRSRTIEELYQQQGKTIEDQRQVINEKTFHLFKEIIMRELVNELRKMVFELEKMKDNINRLLEKRHFGNYRYRFSLNPKKEFKHLVDIIANMDMVRARPEKELRVFFEDHKQDIINTEAGEIPELLDYRNWYRFEMQITTVAQDGSENERIAMTRRVKSIGSGGEQAVPNYLLVLTIAHFLYQGNKVKLKTLLFDEAFYGIDAGRRDQLLGFAGDLGLQLFVASPDQDGVKREIDYSTTVLIVKDASYDVHTYKFDWKNPNIPEQQDLFEKKRKEAAIAFGEEQGPEG